ncbi:sugar transferase [Streptomyces sp. TP-A0874]|uniref:sugar transferase n=1 Tax=Streptomyces sp. TP-A0874 TaxID=549819 RepID=UPI000853E7FF|nr:sugar transferase [Streptomyces sp. TP-A0874]
MSSSGAVRPLSGRTTVQRQAGGTPVWYLPAVLFGDLLGAGLPLFIALRGTEEQQPTLVAVVAAAGWLGTRAARGRYAARSLGEPTGVGPALSDWLMLLGVLAVLRSVLGVGPDPVPALTALSLAPLLTLCCHGAAHRRLTACRRAARSVQRVLVVGEACAADALMEQLAGRTDHPYVVVGLSPLGGAPARGALAVVHGHLPTATPPAPRGDHTAVLTTAARLGAELALIAPGSGLDSERLRRLCWALHDAGLPVALAPGLTEVAPRRLRLSSAAGLPLLHVAPPARRGLPVVVKHTLDRAGAALGLLLLAPLFGLLALAVRLDSAGPALYRQTRLGLGGSAFTMWKFRTMVVDAPELRARLSAVNEQDGPLFKIRRDPRVTRVGRILRRTSLDELPQLVNVLRGEMSLVGPRPPLPEEAARYDETEARRLAVRPGMTGLWQVSGRSELSWDETVALDLRYADNWSLGGDLRLILRTLRAVVDGRGAY